MVHGIVLRYVSRPRNDFYVGLTIVAYRIYRSIPVRMYVGLTYGASLA